MTDKERGDLFLKSFKELENHVLAIAKIQGEGHVSFSKALNDVYYQRKNPLISQYDNYDFLKTAADLRNILSHEDNICYPSDEFLTKFIHLKDSIIHPLTCYSVCSKKVFSCRYGDSVLECLGKMTDHSLSHLPLLDDDGCVAGIFSRNSLFDYFQVKSSIQFDTDTKLDVLLDFLPLENHLNERFVFVGKNKRVDEVYPMLFKNKEHDKNISLLLVTEHGRSTEKLLGVITSTDLAKYHS